MLVPLSRWATKKNVSKQLAHWWMVHKKICVQKTGGPGTVILIDDSIPIPDHPPGRGRPRKAPVGGT